MQTQKKENVCIYQKKNGSDNFAKVFEFAPGMVRHIHSLIPDKQRNCVYILTGDRDSESGFWVAKNDFTIVEPLLVGDQKYRSCIAFLTKTGFIYSTDTPERDNAIYSYEFEKGNLTKLFDMPSSCTLGCKCGDVFIFGTSIETAEPKKRTKVGLFKYWFGRKLAAGVKDNIARVYSMDEDGNVTLLLEAKKDVHPAGLARFGRFLPLYNSENNSLYFYGIALKKFDGKLYKHNN